VRQCSASGGAFKHNSGEVQADAEAKGAAAQRRVAAQKWRKRVNGKMQAVWRGGCVGEGEVGAQR